MAQSTPTTAPAETKLEPRELLEIHWREVVATIYGECRRRCLARHLEDICDDAATRLATAVCTRNHVAWTRSLITLTARSCAKDALKSHVRRSLNESRHAADITSTSTTARHNGESIIVTRSR